VAESVFRPGVGASGRNTPASYPFYTTGEDNLRVLSYNSAAGVRLKVNGRLIDAAGHASPDSWDHIPNTDRSVKSDDLPLSGTTLLNLTVFAAAGSPRIGQTFVIVQLIRGLGSAAIVLGTILSGYVTTQQALGFPGSSVTASTDGEPTPRQIVGATPAAGSDIVETVPTGARWELLSTRQTLTLSAAGIAAPVRAQIDDGANVYAETWTPNTGGLSTVNPIAFSQDMQDFSIAIGSGNFCAAPLAGNRMLAGSRFSVHSTVNPAAVTWSAPVYNVREWLEVN